MKIPKELYNTVIVGICDENMIKTLVEMPYNKYLKTIYWHELKKTVHKIFGKKCEVCDSKNDIHIHHFNYSNRGKETFNDIAILCSLCHHAMHKHEEQIFHPIANRIEFEKFLKTAEKIKKSFDNKRYIKLLPLTKKPFWSIEQLSMLWEQEILTTTEFIESEVNIGLITKVTFNNDEFSNYCIKHFAWYLIEFEYPKIS